MLCAGSEGSEGAESGAESVAGLTVVVVEVLDGVVVTVVGAVKVTGLGVIETLDGVDWTSLDGVEGTALGDVEGTGISLGGVDLTALHGPGVPSLNSLERDCNGVSTRDGAGVARCGVTGTRNTADNLDFFLSFLGSSRKLSFCT